MRISSHEDVAVSHEELWERASRHDFYAFRQYINYPRFKKGWFQKELASALQGFYNDLLDGLRPILILSAPPQHGKSSAVVDFIAWMLGKLEDPQVIYASYSDRLGVRANRNVQRIIESKRYQGVFRGEVWLPQHGQKGALRTNEYFETQGKFGSFRNTTVNGSITGESLTVGLIDDPVKGRAEANSKTVQERTWNWFTDDFFTRFSEDAGLLMILTRWSVIDLAARLVDSGKEVKTVVFRAVAEEDERYRKEGEALFPEHKSLEFLLERKATMSSANWSALYQQNPVIDSGNIFKFEFWRWWDVLPKLRYKFIVADTAQKTNNWNDYTVFQCWGYGADENIYLLDQLRGRIEAPELRHMAELFYKKHNRGRDGRVRCFHIEDKASGIGLIQELRKVKVNVSEIPRRVDKIERAHDAVPYIESGRVFLSKNVKDVSVIVDEGVVFPNGVNDDTVDCVMNAIEVAFLRNNRGLVW